MSLGQPPDEYDMLEETQADLSLKVRLWESVRDWRAIKSGIVAVTLSEIDVSALEKKVSGYSRVCAQASRVLPGNPVVASLSAEIHAFSPILPIVSDLRSPALKDRHWQQLDSALGFEISSTESLSLGDLIARGIAQHADAISGYAASAVHEAVLEEMLAKVAVVWETAEVEVKSYKEAKDVFVLGDISEVLASLDDSLVTISTIQGSRYVGGIKDIVEAWKTRLVRMQSTLDEWMACQRNWMYLEPIFSSPDIVRQLPAAAKMFASVDKSWKAIMRATADDPLAIKQGTVADRCEIFAAHNVALDKIQKNLEDYLETKRAAFPRFYFLGNEELLEILSQAREPQAVQPHLQKCFENLVGLQFGPEPGSIDIGAMISSEGERVSLGRNLKARGCVEDWLSQVEARMKVSLHGLMKAGLIDYDSRPRVEWVGAHAGQIVATVAQMMWVRGTEKALRNEEGTADGMRLWAKEYANELNQLVVRIRGDLSKLERKIIVALVTTDVHARDILDELVHGNATSVDDFAWVQQLRYYWDAAEDDCVIRHSDAVLRYGWEYMGAASRYDSTTIASLASSCDTEHLSSLALSLSLS
jgi:dynein heavy chain